MKSINQMSYFERLNTDIINIIILDLSYDDLCEFLRSKIIDESRIDYKYLFYYMDKECTGKILKRPLRSFPYLGEVITKYTYIEYYGLKFIIKNDCIMNLNNAHKILYTMLINTQFNTHDYFCYLNNKSLLYKLDKKLYNFIIQNKTFINVCTYRCIDEIIKLDYIPVYQVFANCLECNLRSSNAIEDSLLMELDDMHNLFLNKMYNGKIIPKRQEMKYNNFFHMEILIHISYLDNIIEITNYLLDKFEVSKWIPESFYNYECDLKKTGR